MAIKETLKKLCQAYGPVGRESEVAKVIKSMIEPYCESVEKDIMGNLIALKKGNSGKKLMVAAHMDEIGLIVTHIDEKGFLRFDSAGSVSPWRSIYRVVQFENGMQGIIGYETKDKEGVDKLKLSDLFIDIGATSREKAMEKVSVGDLACFSSAFVEMGSKVTAPALDNRASCAVLVELIKELKSPADDVYFVFTAQEEVGLRGATTSAFSIEPDGALALDVTPITGTPGSEDVSVELGGGPAIKIKDNASISNPVIVNWLESIAKEAGIITQREVLRYGGTDAGAMQRSRGGTPSGTISIPTRYVHSQQELADLEDMQGTLALLKAVLERGMLWIAGLG